MRSAFDEAAVPVNLNWGRSSAFPGLTKIRENSVLLEHLRETRLTMESADALLTLLPASGVDENIWQTNLRSIIEEWREETNNIPQPVSMIEEYFYETLSDQNRSKNLGNGIFLSTVHSVKGLEFDHVFILGDNWKEMQESEMEEERRLYYVAMSRARETLHLFSMRYHENPHTAVLSGDYLVAREKNLIPGKKFTGKRYRLLGMKDLFIDFAGIKGENHPVRKALQELQTGDRLQAQVRSDQIELVGGNGVSVGRLSKAARVEWGDKLNLIKDIRVVALVQRNKRDIQDAVFGGRCYGESWEVPIVEVVY